MTPSGVRGFESGGVYSSQGQTAPLSQTIYRLCWIGTYTWLDVTMEVYALMTHSWSPDIGQKTLLIEILCRKKGASFRLPNPVDGVQ